MRYYQVVKSLLILAACAIACIAPACAQRQQRLNYTFTPDTVAPVSTLHVQLTFPGNSNGLSKLNVPTTWAGQRDLFSSIQNVKSLDKSTVITRTSDNSIREVQYPPNHLVEISYDLTNKPGPSKSAAGTSGAFIFNGQSGLLYPDMDQTTSVQASFEWKDLPGDWIVVSSFGTDSAGPGSERVREQPREQAFDGEWRKVYDAVFSAGDFRLTSLEQGGESLTLATTGRWQFTDKQAAEEVFSIFRAERKFWGEVNSDHLLVLLTPDDQDSGTSDGTVFTGAFLLHLSLKENFGLEEKSLLAHEIFHIWNPYRMGLAAGEATEWFTEGFTHYYQDRILLQDGTLNYPGYLKRLNQIVAAYWNSPDRNWPQRQWLDRTSTGMAEYALPYKRGAMVALWLDQRIRSASANNSSLDNRMVGLADGQDKLLTAGFLISALSTGLSHPDASAFRSFVSDGVTIPLPAQIGNGCGELVKTASAAPYYKPTGRSGCDSQAPAGKQPVTSRTTVSREP